MRRKDREVTHTGKILEIIEKADVIRLAMYDGNEPYLVTLNYGYEHNDEYFIFYMHCANEGRKLEILARHPRVCFGLDTEHVLKEHQDACGWSMSYKSIIGHGNVEIVNNSDEKIKGLSILMNHYDTVGKSVPYDFSKLLNQTTILKLTCESICCKVKPQKP